MELNLSDQAADDLQRMDNNTYLIFEKHIDKIAEMPPWRHLKYGIPVHVEEVGQGRIIYQILEDTLFVMRGFTDHKDYEKWYRSKK